MEDGIHVAPVLLDLLLQIGQAPVAVMGHGDGAGNFALYIHLQCLSWPVPVCKQPRYTFCSMSVHLDCIRGFVGKLSQPIEMALAISPWTSTSSARTGLLLSASN